MKRNIIAIAIVLGLFGCQNAEKKYESVASTDAVAADSASVVSTENAEKIIKTADMRFRVKDVQSTKEKLSKVIKAEGGTVAEFSIQSVVLESDKVKQSADSLKEITSYRTEGYLVAKVPSEKLDEFTNTIAQMSVFVDNQLLKMDDQSIAYLANKLKAENRIEAVGRINKLATKKSPNVETSMLIKDDLIDKKIENMLIDNKVKYSNITLNFYQDNTVKTMIVANDTLSDYRPAFATRLWLNIVNGWSIFMELVLALANLWMLILAAVLGVFVFKYYRAKRV